MVAPYRSVARTSACRAIEAHLRPEGEGYVYATLHEFADTSTRTLKELVEVRVDGRRVGQLTPKIERRPAAGHPASRRTGHGHRGEGQGQGQPAEGRDHHSSVRRRTNFPPTGRQPAPCLCSLSSWNPPYLPRWQLSIRRSRDRADADQVRTSSRLAVASCRLGATSRLVTRSPLAACAADLAVLEGDRVGTRRGARRRRSTGHVRTAGGGCRRSVTRRRYSR